MVSTINDSNDPVAQSASDWWLRLRDPDCSEQTTGQWLAWFEADERHRQAFEAVCQFAEQLDSVPAMERQALSRSFATQPARTAMQRSRTNAWLAVAAVLVVAVLGGVWVAKRDLAPSSRSYASQIAQTQQIALPDGSSIELGASSSLTTKYARSQRHVDLVAGEAFFHVTHDEARPFVVNAGPLSILDLGTAFNVRRTGERVVVAVTEGRVRVSPNQQADASNVAGVEVTAGHQVSFDPGNASLSVSPVTTDHATAWRNHRLEFVNEPLVDVVANVNRYSQRPVRIADADLGGLSFTGTVKTDAIDSWVSALPRVFPLEVTTYPDHVELARQRSGSDKR
ncbi:MULTISPECIES: FecR family protein [Dyella]|uniref:DUF4880 domain-containing protein n=2 Tax=Dyella TaxID=231454 RepID=A0A4V2NME9_9GAMM|nr:MULTISPECIES: FecR domain-containing protein [Dyella]TBR39335.1 DUF4880 domain-containing protein [Dyella terrae]TCI13077.1 DUF4880 domain-containing protein [Dyella soli]